MLSWRGTSALQEGYLRSTAGDQERAIALQRETEIFGRNIVPAVPLTLELSAFGGENLGQPLHCGGYESVRVLYGAERFVHKTGLDPVPLRPEVPDFFSGKEWGRAGDRCRIGAVVVPRLFEVLRTRI